MPGSTTPREPRSTTSEPRTPRERPRLLCSPVPPHCSFFLECHSSRGLAPTHSSSLGSDDTSFEMYYWPALGFGVPPPPSTFLHARELITVNYNDGLTCFPSSSVFEATEAGTTRFYSSWDHHEFSSGPGTLPDSRGTSPVSPSLAFILRSSLRVRLMNNYACWVEGLSYMLTE